MCAKFQLSESVHCARSSRSGILVALLGTVLTAAAQPVAPGDGQVFTSDTVLVPGTYLLPHGVLIGASGITVDLNGATLVGNSFTNFGVTSIGHDNVIIRNGTIQGYFYGVRI